MYQLILTFPEIRTNHLDEIYHIMLHTQQATDSLTNYVVEHGCNVTSIIQFHISLRLVF